MNRALLLSLPLSLLCSCAEGRDPRQPASHGSGGLLVHGGGTGNQYGLPNGFRAADRGGWRLGSELDPQEHGRGGSAGAGPSELGSLEPCTTELLAVVRDFRRGDLDESGHPDFQTFSGSGASLGMVESELGGDRKPLHSETGPYEGPHGQQTTSRERFDEWYRAVVGVNRSYLLELAFEPNGEVLTFESSAFFPVDGAGWGNEKLAHNYHFTTELHTEFVYRAGDRFTFSGDDDLWVFINGRLVIDLGGLHPPLTETIELDELADDLGLTPGGVYSLELFHAERRAVYSNFRVDTNLEFTQCRVLNPIVR